MSRLPLFETDRWNVSIQHLGVLAVVYIAGVLVLGTLMAVFIDQQVKGESWFRTIFLYPFATVMRDLSVDGLILMGVFLVVLLVPFAYLLSTGALEWGPVKQVVARAGAGVLRAAGMPGRGGLDPDAPRVVPADDETEQAA